MKSWPIHHEFRSRLVLAGFGCIGQGVLPLLLRHIGMRPEQVLIVTPTEDGTAAARELGVPCLLERLTPGNYREVLEPRLAAGDFLLNLSIDVASVALIALCQSTGALYLDSCIEPWAGGHLDPALPLEARSNHALRESALALRNPGRADPTAVLAHGANPGLVSHLFKQALLDVAAETGLAVERPRDRQAWARLAAALGVRVLHVAERDTQVGARRKAAGEFVNTWSVKAFVEEALQPAELGWGSHERTFPADGARHASGSRASIFLRRPGAGTRVRSWTPLAGPYHGFLITHGESISIADYFTVGEGEHPAYRPTVHYAYHPCDDAVLSLHELAGKNWVPQREARVMTDEITGGVDELGVLLMGHPRGAYWYGSRLAVAEARALCPHNNATSMQVATAVMAGVVWTMKNPQCGVIEPDQMPFDEVLALCRPYLGELFGAYSDWTPLEGRGRLYDEDLARDDPWQFQNFRVT